MIRIQGVPIVAARLAAPVQSGRRARNVHDR
jgi:hypothetical protein